MLLLLQHLLPHLRAILALGGEVLVVPHLVGVRSIAHVAARHHAGATGMVHATAHVVLALLQRRSKGEHKQGGARTRQNRIFEGQQRC